MISQLLPLILMGGVQQALKPVDISKPNPHQSRALVLGVTFRREGAMNPPSGSTERSLELMSKILMPTKQEQEEELFAWKVRETLGTGKLTANFGGSDAHAVKNGYMSLPESGGIVSDAQKLEVRCICGLPPEEAATGFVVGRSAETWRIVVPAASMTISEYEHHDRTMLGTATFTRTAAQAIREHMDICSGGGHLAFVEKGRVVSYPSLRGLPYRGSVILFGRDTRGYLGLLSELLAPVGWPVRNVEVWWRK